MYLSEFQKTGRKLAQAGLVSGASGNLSLRLNDHLLITTHGSKLGRLTSADVVEAGLYVNDASTCISSSELLVHRAIYRATPARAIIHAHPAHAVALTLADKASIIAHAPIVGETKEIVPGAFAEEVASVLKTCPLVMVRGHGSFATGQTLGEALRLTLDFEEECRKLGQARGLRPSHIDRG
jgi:L-fuculose-phosphate aldolase